MRFKDKVAVVTGAGQGIGEAYAKGLAAEGAAVVINSASGRGQENDEVEATAKLRDSVLDEHRLFSPRMSQRLFTALLIQSLKNKLCPNQ